MQDKGVFLKMNSLQLGWIDYSNEHKNKVMAVLDLLSQKGAVDELGIGQIRDGFSDLFFPGTSTLQTRAKYFVIVPYILMELEKKSFSSPNVFLDTLYETELDLIDILKESTSDGVIGGRSGRKLKRKPSSTYWNGLRTFEIFKYENLTLDNYAKSLIAIKQNKNATINLGRDDIEGDGELGGTEHSGVFWHSLFPADDWKETLRMDLDYQEAKFLKERITKSSNSEDSLFAFLLQQNSQDINQIEDFAAIGDMFEIPDTIKPSYELAKSFSKFISGANIRYNVILSKGENDRAVHNWQEWMNSSFVKSEFAQFPYQDVTTLLEIKNGRLKRFLNEWQQAVIEADVEMIDQLIIKREIELKTRDRAKLNNTKVYAHDGQWVGSDMLQYRFMNARILMNDIFTGLEG